MTVIAYMLSRASGTPADVETIKTIAIFSGAVLTVFLLLAFWGLDLSPGLF